MAAKIKKGDTVVILSGKDKGREGEVLSVRPKEDRVLVQGINMIARHTKPSQAQSGGIIRKEAPLHISNVAVKDPTTGKPARIGFKIQEDGKKVRFAKGSGEVLDG
ncbi:50S ribosomal protein L24 [Parvularcula sp. IMCC14364]|uniref:50S ribosomal protein L24 n=1 Tax=Parvularcula sp. IMCC14364 TaxID=3067902 RepID=UPI002740C7A9|nr:50S ribosomal protein L24 [Parvularcula sp. IMCC14364]